MARRQEDNDEDDQRSYSDTSEEESESEEEDESEEEEGGEEEEEDADGDLEADEAKHNLVEADLSEIKNMIEEMSKIKMRLQFRLAREQAGLNQGSSPRRRSSWEDIAVPVTAAASVQTTWDMPRMYTVEKIISSHESRLHGVPAPEPPQRAELPVAPSVQLSLGDLTKSYGIENAAFREDSLYRPQLSGDSSKPPQAMEECSRESVRPPKMSPNAELSGGIVTGGAGSTNIGNDSVGSMGKPPKLHRSQLIPESESSVQSRWPSPADSSPSELRDSFGTPTSPTHAAASIATANAYARDVGADGQGKTMEQKELEAMKNLLFF